MSSADARAGIVEVGRRLYARGLISGNEGNISCREGERILITPAGVCKGFLAPGDVVVADPQGRKLEGTGRVSTETLMHTAVYARRPDVRAIVHAHPPTATAFAVAGIPLDRPLIAEAVVTLGAVPVIPYGTPSTTELASHVAQAICDAHALLLSNHGALAVGDSLLRAWERMETLEQLARISLIVRQLGQSQSLPPADVERLLAQRSAAGYPPPSCAPSAAGAALQAPAPAGADEVRLSRAELARLIAEAVEQLGGGRT
jgi:L-fuculose-phosphate aldolase